MLNFNKHGGDRGDRHDLCRSPTIVLYRAVKVPSGTAGTIPDIIILKGNNSTPVPDSCFNNIINRFQSSTAPQDAVLQVCFEYIFADLFCLVTHCMGGGRGCYQLIVIIIIIIIISISISIIIIALSPSGVVFLWYVKAGLGTKPKPDLRFKRDLNQNLKSKSCLLKKRCVLFYHFGRGWYPSFYQPQFFGRF